MEFVIPDAGGPARIFLAIAEDLQNDTSGNWFASKQGWDERAAVEFGLRKWDLGEIEDGGKEIGALR